jgi:Uma2 family endonuclease
MPATTEALSDYEKERGKPLPSFSHGTIQADLIIALGEHRSEFSIVSELSLELPVESKGGEANGNAGSGDRAAMVRATRRTTALRVTPDISVYRKKEVDWTHDVVRMTEPPLLAVEIVSPTQPQ